MGIIDDAFRAAIDKLSNLAEEAEEIVDFVEEVFKQFTNWSVEEYPTLEEFAEWFEEYYKEKPTGQMERIFLFSFAFLVMRTQNTKKPCGNKPLMFWSGFV